MSAKDLPKERKNEKTKKKVAPGFCPNCNAYVGAYYRCDWCGTRMPHGVRLRVTQVLSVFLVIFGLIAVGVYAGINPAPMVSIGDIDKTYSNGTITIQGTITNIDTRSSSDGSWKTLIFTVTDDTGSINVKAYTETFDEMINDLNTPAIGFNCTVRGSVFVKGDDLYMLIESSKYLNLIKNEAINISIDDLHDEFTNNYNNSIGKLYRVNGTVTMVGENEAYIDLDNNLRIFFPEYIREFSPSTGFIVIQGDKVEVVGILADYYGAPELIPSTLLDIKIIG